MDIDKIPALVKAVSDMADRLAGIDTGEVFRSFTCSEIDTVATVLALGGHVSVAAFVVNEHAMGDDPATPAEIADPDWFGDDHAHIAALHTDTEGSQALPAIKAARKYAETLLDLY